MEPEEPNERGLDGVVMLKHGWSATGRGCPVVPVSERASLERSTLYEKPHAQVSGMWDASMYAVGRWIHAVHARVEEDPKTVGMSRVCDCERGSESKSGAVRSMSAAVMMEMMRVMVTATVVLVKV